MVEYVREKVFCGHVQRILVEPYCREVAGNRSRQFVLRDRLLRKPDNIRKFALTEPSRPPCVP